MSEKNSTRSMERVLGRKELLALSIGQVIGAGVITVIGSAISFTGRGTWVAYGIAVLLGLIIVMPYIIISSMARLRGGMYSMVVGLLGERAGGMFLTMMIPSSFALSLYGVSVGMYFSSVFPVVNPKVAGIAILTVFYILNILGVKGMAKVQKAMTWLLIFSLAAFAVLGLSKVMPGSLSFGSPDYFKGVVEGKGMFTAVVLLAFSTTGYYMTINYGGNAINAKKDIPWAMIMTFFVIAVLYCGVGFVASNVLPVSDVAGKPLTVAAGAIMSKPLVFAFVIGGPLMALCSTLNSTFAATGRIYLQGAADGWLPSATAKLNKYGQPYIMFTIMYLIATLPIILGISVTVITSNIVVIGYIIKVFPYAGMFMLPKKYPEACANSKFFVNKGVFYTIMCTAVTAQIFILVVAANEVTPALLVITLIALGLSALYALYRHKGGYVHMDDSFELED